MFRKLTYISVIWIVLVAILQACCQRDNYCVTINNTSLTAYNNADSLYTIAGKEGVPGKALALELRLDNNVVLCFRTNTYSLLNTAYARTCRNRYVFIDSITGIHITADKDYDASHPAGTELNEYFKMPATEQLHYGEEETTFMFYALTAPQKNDTFIYTVRLMLADGNIIEPHTQPVNVLQ